MQAALRLVAAVALACGLAGASPLLAQQQNAGGGTDAGAPTFTPSVSLMGSLENNPQRVAGQSGQVNFYAAAAELPFVFRGPRWTLQVAYRPGYQYYREDDSLTNFDHAGTFALRGALSPRTTVRIEGDAYLSNELQGLDATEIVTPRTRQARGEVDAVLTQQLGPRDSIDFRARYGQLVFPDGEFVDSRVGDFSVGYGRALSTRVTVTASGGVRWSGFDNDTQARSAVATVGGRFQLAPRTQLEVDGGVLWIQQDLGVGWVTAEQPGITVRARLGHDLERLSLNLDAERDMGTRSGLGQATLRDRITGSVGWADNRLNLIGLVGYARNQGLGDEAATLPQIRTFSACGSAAVRVNRVLAIVGSALFAHQLGELQATTPETDTFRVALGIRLQANAVPLRATSTRFRFDSLARSARAAC